MSIDQAGLHTLLSTLQPKTNLAALKERRDNLWQKLNQQATNPSASQSDTKQIVAELSAADQQLQQATYNEVNRKLEIERCKREAEAAKKLREKEKKLAKHERVLYNASMNKLFSAIGNLSQYQALSGTGAVAPGAPGSGLPDKASEIDRDLKESVQFGIAAAEVARRRKHTQQKLAIEEARQNQTAETPLYTKTKKKKKSLNIII
ncbi:hypothetical protein P22_3403 [Propionispora sp. 2/2-37]|uniref:hypothetical protein n=1 Tax=Propionispora sp. 2/2-37 TaxID=1677858 RepID=UPI0006BB7055|nr:hypothetical protein [Propionispora sp. 2/2-37]CUH97276.1 hypothetical protein P22_3403 [Propionispora sp. 2/2-37]